MRQIRKAQSQVHQVVHALVSCCCMKLTRQLKRGANCRIRLRALRTDLWRFVTKIGKGVLSIVCLVAIRFALFEPLGELTSEMIVESLLQSGFLRFVTESFSASKKVVDEQMNLFSKSKRKRS